MQEIFKKSEVITRRLTRNGFIAYWAGGCVRDKLLGRVSKDVDIATNAKPDEVLSLFPNAQPVGKHFGVILVHMEGYDFDVATFRKEGLYKDGRHPETIAFCGPDEDARRRDFTINGMFFDPASEKVIDYVNGREDLDAGLIRCIGEPSDRFREDHLRMMRAVRFAATLNFDIEERTYRAIISNAHQIGNISAERVQTELNRILLESDRTGDAISILKDVGLLAETIPEMMATVGQEQPPEFHPEGDVFTHTVMMLNKMRENRSLELALSVLLHDVGKPPTAEETFEPDGSTRIRFNRHAEVGAGMAQDILQRLKYSNATIKTVVHCINNHMRFKDVQEMRKSKLRRFVADDCFPIELELHRLDCACSHGMLQNYQFLEEKMAQIDAEPVLPPCLVNGNDIMELGVPQGPKVGELLKEAYDYQLESDSALTKEELLNWILKRLCSSKDEDQFGEDSTCS